MACENNLNSGVFTDSYLCGSKVQLLDAKVLQISSGYMLMLYRQCSVQVSLPSLIKRLVSSMSCPPQKQHLKPS